MKFILVNSELEDNVKSISLLRIFEKDSLAAIIDTFIDYIEIKEDNYDEYEWVEMQFIYKIHESETIVNFRKEKDDIISDQNKKRKKEVTYLN